MDKIRPDEPTWTATYSTASDRLAKWLASHVKRKAEIRNSADGFSVKLIDFGRRWFGSGSGPDAAIHAALDAAGAKR